MATEQKYNCSLEQMESALRHAELTLKNLHEYPSLGSEDLRTHLAAEVVRISSEIEVRKTTAAPEVGDLEGEVDQINTPRCVDPACYKLRADALLTRKHLSREYASAVLQHDTLAIDLVNGLKRDGASRSAMVAALARLRAGERTKHANFQKACEHQVILRNTCLRNKHQWLPYH